MQRGQFLQTVLNSARRGAVAALDVTTPCVLEDHTFFHTLAIVVKAIQAKVLKSFRSYSTKMLVGYTLQTILVAMTALAKSVHLAPLAS